MWFTPDVKRCPRFDCLPLQITKAEGMVFEAQNPRELEDGRVAYEEVDISTAPR